MILVIVLATFFSGLDREFIKGSGVVFDVVANHVNDLEDNLIFSIYDVINLSRFSSLKTLKIVTGYVRHFVSKLNKTLKNGKTIFISDNALTTNE